MIIAFISDRHGKDFCRKWLDENILNPAISKFVFAADWFDSFDKSIHEQIKEFNADMKYITMRPDDVIYLKANHDAHYIKHPPFAAQCTGFQSDHQFRIRQILSHHWKSFCHVYHIDNWMFSHAGVSNTLRHYFDDRFGEMDVDEFVAMANESDHDVFYRCHDDGSGCNSGSMWIRPTTLKMDLIPNINQCFGHTYTDEPILADCSDDNSILLQCDSSCIALIDTENKTYKIVR